MIKIFVFLKNFLCQKIFVKSLIFYFLENALERVKIDYVEYVYYILLIKNTQNFTKYIIHTAILKLIIKKFFKINYVKHFF